MFVLSRDLEKIYYKNTLKYLKKHNVTTEGLPRLLSGDDLEMKEIFNIIVSDRPYKRIKILEKSIPLYHSETYEEDMGWLMQQIEFFKKYEARVPSNYMDYMNAFFKDVQDYKNERMISVFAGCYYDMISAKTVNSYIKSKKDFNKEYRKITKGEGFSDEQIEFVKKVKKLAKAEEQSCIRAIIEREKEESIEKICKQYMNNKDAQEKVFDSFKKDLVDNEKVFDEETLKFVDDCFREFKSKIRLFYEIPGESREDNELDNPIEIIDDMEGIEFEKVCADILSGNGFKNIMVTQGSGDQGIDVLAEKDDIKYAIQCKRYSSKLSNTPIQEVHAGRKYYKCQIGVVMTNNYFTKGAIELAEETGTLLWDRDKLIEMISNKDS